MTLGVVVVIVGSPACAISVRSFQNPAADDDVMNILIGAIAARELKGVFFFLVVVVERI